MPIDDQPARIHGYEREEFVVSLPYATAVAAVAEHDFGVACDLTDSPRLNLTLVRPRGLDRFEKALADAARARRGRPDSGRVLQVVSGAEPGTSTLDDLMFCLRYDFAARCDGWIPLMGKNRFVHNVTGQPHVDGGAILFPEPCTPPAPETTTHRGSGVRVGILDTRLQRHPDLAGRYLAAGADLLDDRPVYPHLAGHATFIAGLVLRRAPGAELDVRHTLDDEHARSTLWHLVNQMVDLRDRGVSILNLSLGCFTLDGQPPMVLARAVRMLTGDMVIVAAAGNHGDPVEDRAQPGVTPRTPFWPAALDDVVAVGADLGYRAGSARPAPFSPKLPWVNFTADGEGVVSTYLDGQVRIPVDGHERPQRFTGYARWSGTSFAAATVTGELAGLTARGGPAQDALAHLREQASLKPDQGVRSFRYDAG